MKLLIADDEELTRTGLFSSIDWAALGIEEVFLADDGIHGLESARLNRPEIILCDVRMPRMDGITMLEKIEAFLPDTVAIFMSGYSDKEYLKAAIKLKAINYIEKPLNLEEVKNAVLEAKETYLQKLRSHHGEALHSMETASRLALLFTQPFHSTGEQITALIPQLGLPIGSGTYFTVFMVKLDLTLEPEAFSFGDILNQLKQFLMHYHMDCIYAEKKIRYLVYFVFGPSEPSPQSLNHIGQFLSSCFERLGRFSIAAGDTAHGISRAYQSYTSAVILLQSSFFFPMNTLLTSKVLDEAPSQPSPDEILSSSPEAAFFEALTSMDEKAALSQLETLAGAFRSNRHLLQNPVRDLYYRLFLRLEEARNQQQIPVSGNPGSIAETIDKCFTFDELHQTLLTETKNYFKEAAGVSQENPTIFLIKNYIAQNYRNETLSVKDISAHAYLSASYACTFFKNETGQTLNQYITEYRMEKARQLLKDARYKISDISSKVGYSDGNYFGKSFKKYTGLSPSEYREQNLK